VQSLQFGELIKTADIISLHLPLTEKTHHLINADTIKRMKKGAILINTSRGGLIDTFALVDVLEEHRIVLGLDVFEIEPLPTTHPLWNSENTLFTSHTAWYSERSVPVLQYMAAAEVLRGLEGKKLKNRVV
jgi:D-3-phosphoglycerate dehydrogenase